MKHRHWVIMTRSPYCPEAHDGVVEAFLLTQPGLPPVRSVGQSVVMTHEEVRQA